MDLLKKRIESDKNDEVKLRFSSTCACTFSYWRMNQMHFQIESFAAHMIKSSLIEWNIETFMVFVQEADPHVENKEAMI